MDNEEEISFYQWSNEYKNDINEMYSIVSQNFTVPLEAFKRFLFDQYVNTNYGFNLVKK